MRALKLISPLLFLILAHCIHTSDKGEKTEQSTGTGHDSTIGRPELTEDTSNQKIYEFMKMVITDQKLDKNKGLAVEPEQSLESSMDDGEFLKQFVIEKSGSKRKAESTDSTFLSGAILTNDRVKCLRPDDVTYMVLQKKNHGRFIWNFTRLSFNVSNHDNWYRFSIPLFSKDGDKAVVRIEDLCKGLCGGGSLVFFVKEKEQWVSRVVYFTYY